MIELILDRCLEDIRGRRATIAQCLARYPKYADQLAPLLNLALAVQGLEELRASEEFKRNMRSQLKQQPVPKPHRRWLDLLVPRRA